MASLTDEERAERERLAWVQRYYCDSWLVIMSLLEELRPATARLRDQAYEILNRVKLGEIDMTEGTRLHLDALREWHKEYCEKITVNPGRHWN